MAITISRCFIQVHDPDLALVFYRDVLGLDVLMDVPQGPYRWITFGAPTQPGVSLVASNYVDGSPEDAEAVAALVAKGAISAVHFTADDLDVTFEKIAASGADVIQEPTSQPWGGRDCAVRDPSGNLIRVHQA